MPTIQYGCIVLFTGWFHRCIRLASECSSLMHRWNQPVNKTTHPIYLRQNAKIKSQSIRMEYETFHLLSYYLWESAIHAILDEEDCELFIRIRIRGRSAHRLEMLFPRSFVTQPSPLTSSDNPWKLIFSTIILIDCVSFYIYMYSVFLSSVTARAFVTVSV